MQQGGPGAMQAGPGMGGNQSPFSGATSEAELLAQKFYDKLMADELDDMSDLFSSKASGKAKVFRDGKASESMVSDMKAAFANVKLAPGKQVQGVHIVLLEEGNTNQPVQPAGGRGRPKRKLGKTVQFKVVPEGGKLAIQGIDIRDH